MKKQKKKQKKKSPINWIELALQFIVGLFTGVILLILDRLF